MTDEQASDIIEKVMKAHWPKWEFVGQELKVWIEELRKFDYETAKTAINELYKVWESSRYPKMPIIMGNIRKLAIAKRTAEKRLCRLFTITRQDGRRRWFPFVGDANTPRPEVEKEAERMRAEANRLYPGDNHVVVYHSTDKPEQEKPVEDAEEDIIPF
jgi:hypothetical protein